MRGTPGPEKNAEQELIRLMNQYGGMLSGLCGAMLRDWHRGQDAVQETFIKTYRFLRRGGRLDNDRAWLLRVAMNVCRDMMRQA